MYETRFVGHTVHVRGVQLMCLPLKSKADAVNTREHTVYTTLTRMLVVICDFVPDIF